MDRSKFRFGPAVYKVQDFEMAQIKYKSIRSLFIFGLIFSIFICSLTIGQENSSTYWINIGDEYTNIKSYEEASKAYNKATELDPKSLSAWKKKADVLQILEKYNESAKAYDNVTKLDPKDKEQYLPKVRLLKV